MRTVAGSRSSSLRSRGERIHPPGPLRPRVRLLASLLVLLATAGCSAPSYVGEPDESTSYEQRLAPESFFLANLGLSRPSHVRVELRVVEGGAIDAWLAPDCAGFQDGTLRPLDRALGVTNATLEADLDAGGCVPLDNASGPPGETAPTGPARVSYAISVWRR